MTIKDRFFEELQRAITRGFTLAAVSVAMSCGTPSMPGGDAGVNDGGGNAAQGGGGGGSLGPGDGGGGAGGGGGSNTPQPPRDVDGGGLAEAPGGSFQCTGDAGTTGPYYGACCTNLHCYTPTDATCAAANAITPFSGPAFTPPLPPGSGTCLCNTPTGPFAQSDGGSTECCYVVGSIGCLGRPLREGPTAIVAAVVLSADWTV